MGFHYGAPSVWLVITLLNLSKHSLVRDIPELRAVDAEQGSVPCSLGDHSPDP